LLDPVLVGRFPEVFRPYKCFPAMVTGWIFPDHPARIVDAVVEKLNLDQVDA